ncbi:hypothetical protein MY4824_003433 [Beauveria thailandica]
MAGIDNSVTNEAGWKPRDEAGGWNEGGHEAGHGDSVGGIDY